MISDFISTQPIEQNYYFQQLLGEGAYAQVRKAIFISDQSEYAIKIIDKSRISQDDLRQFMNQCQIMFKLQHPNIVQIYQIYDSPEFFYIVMEYMQGGQLCDQKNIHRCKDQNQIVQIVMSITDALNYCHSQKVVHRDIKVILYINKPQNILWSTKDEQAILKIADFGLARMVGDQMLTTTCGTPMFFAPEILLNQPYDYKVDIWSLGVITYILLSGRSPFEAQDQQSLFNHIRAGKIQFPLLQWKYISGSGKDFVLKLLQRNPKKRYNAEQIKSHPWTNSQHTVQLHYEQRKQNLNNFQTSRKIQKIRYIIQKTISDIQKSEDLNMIDESEQMN